MSLRQIIPGLITPLTSSFSGFGSPARRPLNYDYLRALAPAPQRFYEIVSYKVFAAMKHRATEARLAYSEFCTFSAVQRYLDYDHFKKQMYKIHKPHLDSGYLVKTRYEPLLDADGRQDWMMIYEPGPRAASEFAAFERKRQPQVLTAIAEEPALEEVGAGNQPVSSNLFQEMTRRGISENEARKLLRAATPEQPIAEQLAWGDHLVAASRERIFNPPGFYVYLIREKVLPPAEFLASCAEPQPATPAPAGQEDPDPRGRQLAYEEYRRAEIEHYIATHYTPERYEELQLEKQRAIRKQYRSAAFWPAEHLRQVAEGALRTDAANTVEFVRFEDFIG